MKDSDSDVDAALMLRVQQRDGGAFEQLMRKHVRPLHSYAYRLCQSSAEAEEIVQDTFLRVWSRAKTWVPNRVKFTTWLYQITRNLCIDRFRKQYAEFDGSIDLDLLPDTQTNENKELILALRQVVQELPERQRTALVLCQLQGWSQAETASLLSVSVEAVESLLARARRTLRNKLTTTESPK
ncbi:MAG: sigma-70 family RNA polymerase sigma factor [Gammaproteobacteria bacterium]|nr:sigma-70 family RNA polymerase sigma factor [Gammaproteobacteria bacterium]